MKVTQYRTYEEAEKHFTWDQVWDHFDGNRDDFNVTHECIDRHVGKGIAARIKFADGRSEQYTFDELSELTSRFANGLEELGIEFGDRVAIMLDPCLEFYVSLFGTMKRGAVVVPCFTLFGPEALQYRIKDSRAKVLVCPEEKAPLLGDVPIQKVITAGPAFDDWIKRQPKLYEPGRKTAGKDLAVIQYSSGTTRKFPEGIDHFHKSVALLVPSGVFAMGIEEGDHFFCPSSPAWGNGLWYGTFTPLTLGVGVGAYSGKFDEETMLQALEEFEINNLHAAPTVYRRLIKSGLIDRFNLKLEKLSYAGEPMDLDTFNYLKENFGASPCSLYGSTEVGCIIAQYAGFEGWDVKPGSLGKPLPGLDIRVVDKNGNRVPPGQVGEIVMNRRGRLFPVKDHAVVDEDGYFWYEGRSDDVIISSGWTISPTEVETTLLKHKDIEEAAVVGIPDKERGHIVKAFLKVRNKRPGLEQEIKDYVKETLSK
ncbi:MAG: acyl-CoA synthetase, partial [Deltaproteobacteria bacterium]|nr:acyl-CoA synthetase [Deltaproteobacteria bacterium]